LKDQLAQDRIASRVPHYGNYGAVDRVTAAVIADNLAYATEAAEAAVARAQEEVIALSKAKSHLRDLQEHFKSCCEVIARPTAYIISGGTRQWEYQEMATAGWTPKTPGSGQPNSPGDATNYAGITGAFDWRLGDHAVFPQANGVNGGLANSYETNGFFAHISVETLEDHRIFQIVGKALPLNISAAHDAYEDVKKGLVSKYGPAFAQGIEPPRLYFWHEATKTAEWAKFTDGKSEIDLCRGAGEIEGQCSVEIDYVDLDLAKQAALEKAARSSQHLMKGL
jgi:hypothetical protein